MEFAYCNHQDMTSYNVSRSLYNVSVSLYYEDFCYDLVELRQSFNILL